MPSGNLSLQFSIQNKNILWILGKVETDVVLYTLNVFTGNKWNHLQKVFIDFNNMAAKINLTSVWMPRNIIDDKSAAIRKGSVIRAWIEEYCGTVYSFTRLLTSRSSVFKDYNLIISLLKHCLNKTCFSLWYMHVLWKFKQLWKVNEHGEALLMKF